MSIIEGAARRVLSKSLGSPAVGATTAVHAAAAGATGGVTDITTSLTNPAVPRNVTCTAGGTGGDIKAGSVVVTGTNENDEVITETLPAFTADTPATVVGSKVFKTVTKYTIPVQDGTGATFALGTGAKLGIGKALSRNTVLAAFLNGVREATDPTVAVGATVETTSVTLNSTLNGNPVVVDFYES